MILVGTTNIIQESTKERRGKEDPTTKGNLNGHELFATHWGRLAIVLQNSDRKKEDNHKYVYNRQTDRSDTVNVT